MISIIIPTSNEAQNLSATLDAITAASSDVPHEVIVVDASNDDTAAIAQARGARLIRSAIRQRAAQMNLGAGQAHGDALLFLHGDTLLPAGALAKIRDVLADDRFVGGAFARRYDSPSLLLRITCGLATLRGQWSGWFLGDQAIFVRADVFQRLGGFRDIPLFEDLDFSRRLRKAGRVTLLRPAVVSAARRFQTLGPSRATWADLVLTYRYLRGASPHALAAARERKPRTAALRRPFSFARR